MSPYRAKALVAFTTDIEKIQVPAGTDVVVVEELPDSQKPAAYIVEIAIPDETLVGGNRFDTAMLRADELEKGQ